MSWVTHFKLCNYDNKTNIVPSNKISENIMLKHTTLYFTRTMNNFSKLTQ
jgi:hypothetical protein